MQLGTRWAGRIFGTSTGNLFVQIEQAGTTVTGTVRVNDDRGVLITYTAQGTVTDAQLQLTLTPQTVPAGVNAMQTTITARLQENGSLFADWQSQNGEGGTAILHPADPAVANLATPGQTEVEQVFNKDVKIGAVRLFGDDLRKFIELAGRDFPAGRLVITYAQRGGTVSKYSDAFLGELATLGELTSLKIAAQAPAGNGLSRSISVDLTQEQGSAVRVSGPDESWVLGRTEVLSKSISAYESNIVTTWRKYGLNFNGLMFIAMLVVLPDLALKERTQFVLALFAIFFTVLWVHRKFIPNTRILLGPVTPTLWTRIWPSVLSWAISVTSALFAAWLYTFLEK